MTSDYFKPNVTFSHSEGRICLNTACTKFLEDAMYIRLLFNREKGTFAVQECEYEDPGRRDMMMDSRGIIRIYTAPFVNMIFECMGWNRSTSKKGVGVYYPELKLIEFNLNNCNVIRRV